MGADEGADCLSSRDLDLAIPVSLDERLRRLHRRPARREDEGSHQIALRDLQSRRCCRQLVYKKGEFITCKNCDSYRGCGNSPPWHPTRDLPYRLQEVDSLSRSMTLHGRVI